MGRLSKVSFFVLTLVTFHSLPVITSALYVRKYFDSESKRRAADLVKYVKQEFKDILKSVDWMDETTRRNAIEKADRISDHIGYPDELMDDKQLEKTFGKVRNWPSELSEKACVSFIRKTKGAYRCLLESTLLILQFSQFNVIAITPTIYLSVTS